MAHMSACQIELARSASFQFSGCIGSVAISLHRTYVVRLREVMRVLI